MLPDINKPCSLDKQKTMFYLLIRNLALILCTILFRLQVFGKNNIPRQGGFILAANHTSYLDPPLLAVASPRVFSFLAKEELFRLPVFGRFIRALNAFPLKTNTADVKALRWAIQELESGGAIIIFPEGGRITEGQLVKPLKGVGFLAVKANCPIVPAYIEGSSQALPLNSRLVRPRKVKVYFGQPIKSRQLNSQLSDTELYQQIAQKTMEEIRRLRRSKP